MVLAHFGGVGSNYIGIYVTYVVGDGHCGFHIVASLCDMIVDDYQIIRLKLLKELVGGDHECYLRFVGKKNGNVARLDGSGFGFIVGKIVARSRRNVVRWKMNVARSRRNVARCCVFLNRGGNRPGLSLAYEKIYKPEPGLWPIIGRFSWPDLTYLKAWTGLKAYLQAYFILRPSNSSFVDWRAALCLRLGHIGQN
ncbi:hypothetical protein MTR_5g012710 [Medicago truncatula]|uniref:Uncharacterized protein n=1 Tax=Medicago truncatula TaxID=3880 RepID=G7JW41_MEDTR|nr:hypothetical protein MTR_5g012710 [Medicago truncatula]